jgi:hypothetical protein
MSYTIALLSKEHQRKAFDCGQSDLNDFIIFAVKLRAFRLEI